MEVIQIFKQLKNLELGLEPNLTTATTSEMTGLKRLPDRKVKVLK